MRRKRSPSMAKETKRNINVKTQTEFNEATEKGENLQV